MNNLQNNQKSDAPPMGYHALLPAVLFFCDDDKEIEYRGYNDNFVKHLNKVWEENNEAQINLSKFGGMIKDEDGFHSCKNYYLSLAKIEEWNFL